MPQHQHARERMAADKSNVGKMTALVVGLIILLVLAAFILLIRD
jgi:uncharacterized integral membrane protein